jgi:predicted transposase YdaD
MPYVTSIERMAREEGREAGRQQGRVEGRLQARREDILRIVQARFGQMPPWFEQRLASADEGALNDLLLRAATADLADL